MTVGFKTAESRIHDMDDIAKEKYGHTDNKGNFSLFKIFLYVFGIDDK